jgi:hypothetical protein
MRFMSLAAAAALVVASHATVVSGQQTLRVDGDDITMRGCVTAASAQLQMPFETLMWSRGAMLTAGAGIADAPSGARMEELAGRVLYWMDEGDLAEHIGKMVEIRGELEDLEEGEIEIDRDGDFTEVHLKLDGKEETIRVPSTWLEHPRAAARDRDNDEDREIEIATRKVDLKDVKVLGSCPAR